MNAEAEPTPGVTGWSSGQLRALAALSEAFAPGFSPDDYERWGRAAAETLNAVADPADLRQLRLVVSVLDSRLGNLATGSGWNRVSATTGAGRRPVAAQLGEQPAPAAPHRVPGLQAPPPVPDLDRSNHGWATQHGLGRDRVRAARPRRRPPLR